MVEAPEASYDYFFTNTSEIVAIKETFEDYISSKINEAFPNVLADQMLNNCLSTTVLDKGNNRENNDNNVTEDNKA